MPRYIWKFDITHDNGDPLAPGPLGIQIHSAGEIEDLAAQSGFPIVGWETETDIHRRIDITCEEGDSKLKKLIELIETRYGFKPSKTTVVPSGREHDTFGIERTRQYSEEELSAAKLLCFGCLRAIGDQKDGSPEEVALERYVAYPRKPKKKVQLGVLMPFQAIAITLDLKAKLEAAGIVGLETEPVVNRPDLQKFSSSIVLPRCLLPLIGGDGRVIEDFQMWPEKLGGRWFDDDYMPFELRYRQSEIEALGPFDVAVTAERTGVNKERAFRWCVVSQRFREVMKEWKVTGLYYVPVKQVEC